MPTPNRGQQTQTSVAESFKTLSRVLRNLPDAVNMIEREIDAVDGLPTQCIGASPPSGRNANPDPEGAVTWTAVESAAMKRSRHTDILTNWAIKARRLDELASDLEREIMRALPKKENQRCNGGFGRDGHMVGWGTTDCGALADIDGMCHRHIADERAWRASVGKPERVVERSYLEARGVTIGPRGRFTAA